MSSSTLLEPSCSSTNVLSSRLHDKTWRNSLCCDFAYQLVVWSLDDFTYDIIEVLVVLRPSLRQLWQMLCFSLLKESITRWIVVTTISLLITIKIDSRHSGCLAYVSDICALELLRNNPSLQC